MAQQLLANAVSQGTGMTDPVVADYENTVVNSTSLDNLPDSRELLDFTPILKNFDTSEINGEKDIRIYVSLWLKKTEN
jgi:hypothetical protein